MKKTVVEKPNALLDAIHVRNMYTRLNTARKIEKCEDILEIWKGNK